MQTKLPPLLQASSGAVGSAVGNAIVYPLDVATTRMQNDAKRSPARRLTLILTLHRLLSRRNALSRVYDGLEADTLSTFLSSFLYFFAYTTLQKALSQYRARRAEHAGSSPAGGLSGKASDTTASNKAKPFEELIIGILAGITSKGVTLPISTVCVRQQVNESGEADTRSMLDTLKTIYADDGLAGLFRGFGPTIPLTLLPSLTLYIHSVLLKAIVPARHRAHPPGYITFFLGALSNALATIPLYPLVLVKVLDQSGSVKGKEKAQEGGILQVLKDRVGKEGIKGLYIGLEGQLVKGVVQQGVMIVEEAAVRFYGAT
ncbi:hypothetical protein L198_01697 [Cryptococcus wingfieldii CBS 7118]|uniref:Uncharacterized protein n=1 Tax=Cryptococcus wingfieldii CBS 7118 TaxID=1295528 RepID=A0A1E3K085_9TREE|nr:hypothetical protein L198_01697 [Cryptococcus wingfieldii CBS 7118]ODO06465.1 hypothetical protein L198_01697 [Cryptococcus wingfieldii CBS 7118]